MRNSNSNSNSSLKSSIEFKNAEHVNKNPFSVYIAENQYQGRKKISDILLVNSDNDGINSPESFHDNSFRIGFLQWANENQIPQNITQCISTWNIPAGYNLDQMVAGANNASKETQQKGLNDYQLQSFLQWYLHARPNIYRQALSQAENPLYEDSHRFLERIEEINSPFLLTTSTRWDLIQTLHEQTDNKLLRNALGLVAGSGIIDSAHEYIVKASLSKPNADPHITGRKLAEQILQQEVRADQVVTPEDSLPGRVSAINAGVHVIGVAREPEERNTSIKNIFNHAHNITTQKQIEQQITFVTSLDEIQLYRN